ncbi:MAG: septum site-determining protein MinC [Cyanomargarita calcarea GSE-NOS-MK-12-04C]|uniref:Probable septum site-determining protein MinC n=1 Tax=Cyanomargarita calcarea GSE-NOS-MK-12-04C TaxID=2839659 RepID=A0A951QKX5_9CYAN|nr:septum site-determining protein MinC [Cyanomargarita calcarea GSE-NOS-MK-12-04C]
MTSDFAIPNLESNSTAPSLESISALSDLESNPTPVQESNAPTEENFNLTLLDDSSELPLKETTVNKNNQVKFKTEGGKLLLILPTESQLPASELNWSEIWQQIQLRLMAGDRLRIPNAIVHLMAGDRLLDTRQLQELAETLSKVQLQLKSVSTSRRQTAIAAVSAGYSVEQLERESSLSITSNTTAAPLSDALYLEMTVRSGVEIRHPGTVIILGDLNPGGIVVADGDILVWGRLRGVAHAGATGNRECLIMAVQMEPTQLRIADSVARSPEKSPMQFLPEVAYVTPEGIRITRAPDFSRIQISRMNQEPLSEE